MSVSASGNYGVTSAAASGAVVTLSGGTASAFHVSQAATAGFQFKANGNAYKWINGSAFQTSTLTDWIRPDTFAPGNYYVRITNVAWIAGSAWDTASAAEDIWIDLTATRSWIVEDANPFAGGFISVNFDVEISNGNPGPMVVSGTYHALADYEDFICFGPDTIVLMEDDSEKLMKDLVTDDVLKAYSVPNRIDESDPEWRDWQEPSVDSGTFTTSKVIDLNSYQQEAYYLINGELKVTRSHHLLVYRDSVSNWMWVKPNSISVGDTFYSVDKVEIPVTSIVLVTEDITTYNINVEEVDTFYVKVGDEFIVAHNKIAL